MNAKFLAIRSGRVDIFKWNLAIICVALSCASCNNSHRYYEENQRALTVVKNQLIKDKFCSSYSDCSAKQLVSFEAGSGVAIDIFKVDHNFVKASVPLLCQQKSVDINLTYTINYYADSRFDRKKLLNKLEIPKGESCQLLK